MAHYSDIKRKKERFPAFSDEEGVKRRSNEDSLRRFASDDSWIITEQQTESLVEKPKKIVEEKTYRRQPSSESAQSAFHDQEQETLERFKRALPTYRQHAVSETKKTGKKVLFDHQRTNHEQSAKQYVAPREGQKKQPVSTVKKEYSGGRSYFVPKFVPASLIPDDPEQKIAPATLYASMKKEQGNYLLFDTNADYQEKKPGDPSVKRFKKTEQITMTRNEYKAAIKSKDKKRSILDHSLNGLIQDGESQFKENGYFKPTKK